MSNDARVAVFALLVFCPLLVAQSVPSSVKQELNNESVIKLIMAGLSDDLIVSTINALAGSYDTSPDGLIALKSAHASDKVVSAIVLKNSPLVSAATAPIAPPPPVVDTTQSPEPAQKLLATERSGQNGSVFAAEVPHHSTPSSPRVFLQSASKGTNRNAARDQSMEMSKDFEKDCASVQVTIIQQAADYTVLLNHIEVGFARDNQIQVANKDGDLISKTKEGGSIAAGMKKACALILTDWAKK
jgi:hypothetical protein